jgi:seryl-tRNA synthetase
MLDIKWIRENPTALDAALAARGGKALSATLLEIDTQRRDIMTRLQGLQSKRNDLSKEVGALKSKGQDATALMDEVKNIGPQMKELEQQERDLETKLNALLAAIPNVPQADVPIGKDEADNTEVRRWGEVPRFNFAPKPHYDLGEALGMMNFEAAAKLSGSRFAWLSGDLARLERALATFMLDVQTREHGYTEVIPPFLVNDDTAFGTGQLPKFEDDLFKTTTGLWLIPTAEVPLTNFVRDEIVDPAQLPLKFCAYTPCFRSEAGSAGRDTRGYIRMHQFTKVEMVQITAPEHSQTALEEMRRHAENILEKLGLAYRTITLCTGDMGFCSQKTYDLEVWLPAQNTYREISSVSNCGEFQARRMKARTRDAEGKTRFLHTLNGSGLAVGRTLVAVMENYQDADGSIRVPAVLQPYMGGQTRIEAKR